MKQHEEVPVFEAFRYGNRLMWTSESNCIHETGVMVSAKKAGYKVKIRKGEDEKV